MSQKESRFTLRSFSGKPLQHYRVSQDAIDLHDAVPPVLGHHIIALDVSGSMHPVLADVKSVLEKVLTLEEFNNDRLKVSLLTYSSVGDIQLHFKRVTVGEVMAPQSPHLRTIRELKAYGMTCISQVLDAAKDLLSEEEITCISLHSDGYANDLSFNHETWAIRKAVESLRKYPNLFVNTVAYEKGADFPTLSSIASALSGSCVYACGPRDLYEAIHKTTSILVKGARPGLTVDLKGADLAVWVGGRKVLGGTEPFEVRGLPDKVFGVVYRFFKVEEPDEALPETHALNIDGMGGSLMAFARHYLSVGNLTLAKQAVLASKDECMWGHLRALTAPEIAEFAKVLDQHLIEGGRPSSVSPNRTWWSENSGPSVLAILDTLSQHVGGKIPLRVIPPGGEPNYKRRTLKRKVGTRLEDGTIERPWVSTFNSGPAKAWRKVTSIEFSRTSASVSLRMEEPVKLTNAATGDEIEEVAGIPLDLKRYAQYTIVGDGELCWPQILVYLSNKKVYDNLVTLGALSADTPFDPTKPTNIDLRGRPLVDYDFTNDLPLTAKHFQALAKMTVLHKIVTATLASVSEEFTPEQIAELKRHHISPSLYFTPPTTTPYADLQEALSKGEIDVQPSRHLEIGSLEILGLGHLGSGNAYLQRRFTFTSPDGETPKKPTLPLFLDGGAWEVKGLSARTKIDAVDFLCFPIYMEFLGLEDNGHVSSILSLLGMENAQQFLVDLMTAEREEKVSLLSGLKSRLGRQIEGFYRALAPLTFYVGSTGVLPDNVEAVVLTGDQLLKLYPKAKLTKIQKEEGTFFNLGSGVILIVTVKNEYVTRPS